MRLLARARLSRGLSIILLLAATTPGLALAAPPAKPAAPSRPVAPKIKPLAEVLTGDAKKDWEAGKLLLSDGDYAGAEIKFQAAHDASHDARLLWNISACEKSLRHYAKAIDLMKRSIAEGTAVLSEDERAAAAELVRTLEPFTVTVTVEVSEADAEVDIDDRPVGKSPLAPLVLDIGSRKIRARKDGFHEAVTTAPVGGSAQQTIKIALEKDVKQGKLSVLSPMGTEVFVDGKSVGTGRGKDGIDSTLLAGGHALRVVQTGMKVYEREIIINDKETRSVEVVMERLPEPEKPNLRVAVGCGDPEPRGVEDGLAVYIDDSPAAALATEGKKHFDQELNRNVVDYVSFPVAAGDHMVTVRIPNCLSNATPVTVDQQSGGDVKGSLESDASWHVKGPAGSQNWWRIGAGVWMPQTLQGAGRASGTGATTATTTEAGAVFGDTPAYKLSGAGVILQPMFVARYWTFGADIGLANGKATLDEASLAGNAAPQIRALLQRQPSMTWFRSGVRFGGRMPLGYAALSLGIGAGYDSRKLSNLPAGTYQRLADIPYASSWVGLDVQPLCDFLAYGGFNLDGQFAPSNGKFLDSDLTIGITIGVAYQPSSKCSKDHATEHALHGGTK